MAAYPAYPLAGDYLIERHAPAGRRVAVIGSKVYEKSNDRRRHYTDPVGIDMLDGAGVDLVHDMEMPLSVDLFDHVDCCSVLEHTRRPWLVAENVQAIMRDGASLIVTVPFVWRVHGYPADYWRFTLEALDILFPAITWIEKAYYSQNGKVKRPDAMRKNGSVWFEKTEIAAWGVK